MTDDVSDGGRAVHDPFDDPFVGPGRRPGPTTTGDRRRPVTDDDR
jgi:hypothetical protein